ncbi:MAG: cyclic nucleotide-binding domain-containing protein [Actinobacteria bacterium]|nr:cyclic nucleotide-binding domain-containing protein [Actinomycetota bacterium]
MAADERLKRVPIFAGLDDDDLERICRGVEDVHLGPGEVLFREGEAGDRAYVIVSGGLEILKETGPRQVILARRGVNDVIGEMALLEERSRSATARAESATDLLAIPKRALDELLASSPGASRAIFETLLQRERENHDRLRHIERMAQIGTLTAGVAHELNNPAAAVRRGADRLAEAMEALLAVATEPVPDAAARRRAVALARELAADPSTPPSALDRSDAEDALADWLDARGLPSDGDRVGALIDAGAGPDRLHTLLDAAEPDAAADALEFLVVTLRLTTLALALADAAGRISTLVGGLRSHSHLDQAPVQEVDVTRGIEDTLAMLAHEVKHVRVVREYEPDLPSITAFASELNQVWTNLIDNACYAMREAGVEDPTLTLRVHRQGEDVVVEVRDNGPGMSPEVASRIFDAFYTTKPVGEGTGLGLQISHRIVVLEHRGELDVSSEPGRTTFRVVLPIGRAEPAATPQPPTSPVG